jgi:DNA phosphorothioation-dependent restriction protein DptG
MSHTPAGEKEEEHMKSKLAAAKTIKEMGKKGVLFNQEEAKEIWKLFEGFAQAAKEERKKRSV